MTGRLPMRHGLHRPPMYGEPGGLQGETTLAQLLSAPGLRHAGGGQVAPRGERRVAAAARRLRRLLRLPLGLGHVHASGEIRTSSRRWSTPRPAPSGSRTCRSTGASSTRPGAAPPRTWRRSRSRCSHVSTTCGAAYSEAFLRRMGGQATAVAPLPLHAGRALRQLPARALPRHVAGEASVQGHAARAGRHRGPALARARGDRPGSSARSIFISSDNGPHMETGRTPPTRPFRCAKGSTWEGGVRVPGILVWPGMIEAERASDGLFDFTDLLPTAPRSRRRRGWPTVRPLHRRRGPVVVPAGSRRALEPEVRVLLAPAHAVGDPRRRVQVDARVDQRR